MSKNVLVIDDEAAIRKSFVLALEDTRYQVDTAETGEEGIEMEQSKKYDLIFLDLKMPGMDGIETLRELRSANKDTPIYIITAFYEEYLSELKSVEKEGLTFDLIKKPIRDNEILLATKSILEGPIGH